MIRVIKSRGMGESSSVHNGEEYYTILVRKSEWKNPLDRP